MYPSHEAQTRGPSPSPRERTPERRAAAAAVTTETICNGLKISQELYNYLMESYFTNMTSFTIFKPRSIEHKLRSLRSPAEGEALVAAIFSFSARFHSCFHAPGRPDVCPAPEHFATIATTQLEKALDRYADSIPPFWLLQTYVLVAFYELTRSVRSKSWRVLGNCIRLAYEMNLHMIDVERQPGSEADGHHADADRWSAMEERRRAWWAIWEMDVFASTIRRLPLAIDWSQNFTLLPVSDDSWFNNIPQPSCYLALDPTLRWKHLSSSGNNSARAWFIIINSLMCNAQLIAYPMGSTIDWSGESNDDDLHIIENSLFCASNSLPPDLAYHGETLDFRTKASSADISYRQYHSDIYAIHLMTQLVRFMSHHHKVCAQAPAPGTEPSAPAAALSSADASSWSHYMNAAQEIVTIARNSAPDHCKYVNPFLTNTVWFAAAAQVACRVFGPTSRNKQLVESNYELLALVIDRFIAFWDIMGMLKRRLSRVEAGLKGLTAGPNRGVGGRRDANTTAGTRAGGSSLAGHSPLSRPGAIDATQSLPADGSVVDPNSLQYMPMLYDNLDGPPLVDLPFFPDPGQFFPYGLGDLWVWNKATPN
ncbi:hypothetical protein GQ53DRAFT_733920 [Thozetella sp. PMI_491]|nr:hypothetical protein GQ53DRAFT_733920 [Thozetella sp. PMI_491]